jgi:hypothetical protein
LTNFTGGNILAPPTVVQGMGSGEVESLETALQECAVGSCKREWQKRVASIFEVTQFPCLNAGIP